MSCDPYSTTVSCGLSHSQVVLVGDPTGRNGFQKLEALYLWRYLLGQREQYSCHKLFCKRGCSHHCWTHCLPFTSYSHWLPDFRALHIGEGTSHMPTFPKPEETPSRSPWSSSTHCIHSQPAGWIEMVYRFPEFSYSFFRRSPKV